MKTHSVGLHCRMHGFLELQGVGLLFMAVLRLLVAVVLLVVEHKF